MSKRIEGYDLARALAVIGMVFVNFKIVMGSSDGSANLKALISLMEGRASALFVVLAGVGLSLMAAGTRQFALLQRVMPILQRGVLLLVTGLVLATVWPADILHFYGCYFILAAFFVGARAGLLWLSAAMASLISLFMLLFCDYELGWNFESLSYLDFWTPEGMVFIRFFPGLRLFLLACGWVDKTCIMPGCVSIYSACHAWSGVSPSWCRKPRRNCLAMLT